MKPAMRTVWLAIVLSVWGCGDDEAADAGPGGLVDVEVTHPEATPIAPATECTVETARAARTTAGHTDEVCAEVTYETVPPAWGEHYGVWADFEEYDAPVPWGFLVHSMEHGALVLAYACGDSCPEVLAAFRAIKAETRDGRCEAAAGWGHVYRATCLDEASLRAFAADAYAAGPENFCSAGSDRSASGWCPMGDAGPPADAAP
jgi:hypothetical protein